jgi:Tol biopolymer transport system component
MPDNRRLVLEQDKAESTALSLLDTANGSLRAIYSSPDAILSPSVSRDGKRIVYATGRVDWKPLDIGIQDGPIRALRAVGGNSWFHAWTSSGTHYLYATTSSGH